MSILHQIAKRGILLREPLATMADRSSEAVPVPTRYNREPTSRLRLYPVRVEASHLSTEPHDGLSKPA